MVGKKSCEYNFGSVLWAGAQVRAPAAESIDFTLKQDAETTVSFPV